MMLNNYIKLNNKGLSIISSPSLYLKVEHLEKTRHLNEMCTDFQRLLLSVISRVSEMVRGGFLLFSFSGPEKPHHCISLRMIKERLRQN